MFVGLMFVVYVENGKFTGNSLLYITSLQNGTLVYSVEAGVVIVRIGLYLLAFSGPSTPQSMLSWYLVTLVMPAG